MERVLGVDLGSANASVAWVADGEPVLAADDSGKVLFPSMVAYPEDGEVLTGAEARKWRLTDPTRVVGSIRRVLGRDHNDAVVQQLARNFPFRLSAGPSGKSCLALGDVLYGTPEVASEALKALKKRAETALGAPARKCVLVVPAHAPDPSRLALRMAAQVAGLEVVRIINGPTAAALRHVQTQTRNPARRALVFSFGAGGFDAAVVDMAPGSVLVRAGAGDPLLGAEVLDRVLVERLRSRFQAQHGVDLAEDMVAMQRLWGAAENAKVHLSDNPSVEVRLREMTYTASGAQDLVDELDRKDLHAGLQEVTRRCLAVCQEALDAAGVRSESLEGLLMTGGLSRIPALAEAVARQLGCPIITDAQHDGAVAEAAALYGHTLLNRARPGEVPLLSVMDVATQGVVLEVGTQRHKLVARGAPLPAAAVRTLTTENDNQTTLAVRVLLADPAGEGPDVLVGELAVEGLLATGAGEQQVDLSVEVDADGVVTVAGSAVADGRRSGAPVRLGVEALEQELVTLRMRRGEVRV